MADNNTITRLDISLITNEQWYSIAKIIDNEYIGCGKTFAVNNPKVGIITLSTNRCDNAMPITIYHINLKLIKIEVIDPDDARREITNLTMQKIEEYIRSMNLRPTLPPWAKGKFKENYYPLKDGETRYYELPKKDFVRACECVNAMEGIEDPEAFVKSLQDITERHLNIMQEHEGLRKYRSACEQINPDNPMSVAENLGDIVKFMNEFLEKPHYELGGMKSWASYLIDKITDKK